MFHNLPKLTTTILSKKLLRPNVDSLHAINHMKQLHKFTKTHPSFIKGTSYWNHNCTAIYTLSHWTDSKGWESWLGSQERENTYNNKKASEMYETESHQCLSEIVRTHNDIFLL